MEVYYTVLCFVFSIFHEKKVLFFFFFVRHLEIVLIAW